MTARRLPRGLVAAALALALGACAQPTEVRPLGGALTVLGPDQPLIEAVSGNRLPSDWVRTGRIPRDALAIETAGGIAALRVTGAAAPFALIRRTRASLLATPYLSWSWRAEGPRDGPHPVRLVVGLARAGAAKGPPWWHLGAPDTPAAERLISIVWDATALGRGTAIGPVRAEDGPERARYIARGGPEMARRWWTDSVDLSLIHRQLWPGDDQAAMQVRFVGVVVEPRGNAAVMHLANVRLSR